MVAGCSDPDRQGAVAKCEGLMIAKAEAEAMFGWPADSEQLADSHRYLPVHGNDHYTKDCPKPQDLCLWQHRLGGCLVQYHLQGHALAACVRHCYWHLQLWSTAEAPKSNAYVCHHFDLLAPGRSQKKAWSNQKLESLISKWLVHWAYFTYDFHHRSWHAFDHLVKYQYQYQSAILA